MEKKFIRVDEVARELDISISHAYKIMHQLTMPSRCFIGQASVRANCWLSLRQTLTLNGER